jgi:catechol 2,3-dioxygenase-like lactoylglutathione lyase family enzyme
MKALLRIVASAAMLAPLAAPAAEPPPPRPRLLGISHVTFKSSDLARARAFYALLLGFTAEAVPSAAGVSLRVAINERQYVQVLRGLQPNEDRLAHVALETDDVEAMRRYLEGRGVEVPPAVGRDESGNRAFIVRDPEGHAIELVQHAPETWPRRSPVGPGQSREALAQRMPHAGILVGDLDAANRFYGDVLGLKETWRGSRLGNELSWTNMKVPDGDDYLEFMLYGRLPAPDARGTAHHICLEVGDVEQARSRLAERGPAVAYNRPLEPRVGTNRKRQLNLFDPDGTRVELMEPKTVDLQEVPSSTAPPPKRN